MFRMERTTCWLLRAPCLGRRRRRRQVWLRSRARRSSGRGRARTCCGSVLRRKIRTWRKLAGGCGRRGRGRERVLRGQADRSRDQEQECKGAAMVALALPDAAGDSVCAAGRSEILAWDRSLSERSDGAACAGEDLSGKEEKS